MASSDPLPPFSSAGMPTAEPTDLSPPKIANYELVRLIGVGGMGAVFEAWQQVPSRRVALKVLHTNLLTPAFLQRFRQETDILARLEHPLIARIYEVSTTQGPGPKRPVFAMEYVEGSTLSDYLRAHELSLSASLCLLRDIVQAVHVAHQRGVIHGDLKPANLLIDSDDCPRILDFGLARLVDQADQAGQPSPSGRVIERVGTPPYMSPEMVATPALPIDVRCDVYALGVIAAEMLLGTNDVGAAIDVSRRTLNVQADIAWIARMATEQNPERRYPSAAALSEDLERVLTQTPIRARPHNATYILHRYATRHKVLVTAASIAVASILIGATAAAWSLAEARRAQAIAEAQRQEAESNLSQTLQTVDRFMTLLSRSQLALVPEADALRRQLLLDAVAFLEQLAAQHPHDEGIANQKSWAMSHLAADFESMGELDRAESTHQNAIAFLTAVLARNPHQQERTLKRNMAHHWDELGSLYSRANRHQQALRAHQEALAIKQQLLEQAPDRTRYKMDLARTWDDIGAIQMARQLYPDAAEAFLASTVLKRQVAVAEPHIAEHQRRLALSHAALGRARMRMGAYTDALESLGEAKSTFAGIAVHASEGYTYDLARLHGELGQAHAALAQGDKASAYFAEGDRLYRQILDNEPRNTDALMGRAYLLGFWSEAVTGAERIGLLHEAQHLWIQLSEAQPRSSVIRRALRWVETRLGEADTAELSTTPAEAFEALTRGPDSSELVGEHDRPAIIQASDTRRLRTMAGSFVWVQGQVQSVAARVGVGELTFIRFGTLRGHFSGVIHINALPAFETLFGDDLMDLVGVEVVVHGMLSIHDRTPQIILNRPDQIFMP